MADKLKDLFIKERQIQNKHLETGSVDSRIILNGSINSIHLSNGSITLEKFSTDLKQLVLPDRKIFFALANANNPGSDNPFVTRQETFDFRSTWKDPVQTFDQLPSLESNLNKENDIRLVASERQLYLWQKGSWVSLSNNTTSNSDQSVSNFRKNVSIFLYDFTLGQGSEISLTHDRDVEFNRIVQIKEKILGQEEFSEEIEFTEDNNYTKSSFYTIFDTLINISSKQILGSNDIVWDPGIIGLLGEDKDGNNYRVNQIITQDTNGLPKVTFLESSLLTEYEGSFHFSNVIINNNEAVIIRQKNVDELELLRETSQINETAKNVQVFSSKESGISFIVSIRKNNKIIVNYKEKGNDEWYDYVVNYKFGNINFPVETEKFDCVHLLTKPQSTDLMPGFVNNLNGNDMFGLVFLEIGTLRPFFISWSHNFGNPIFFERTSLDESGEKYEDINLTIKERSFLSDNTFNINSSLKKKIHYGYPLAITGSIINSDNVTGKIALWINDDVGKDFQNWNASNIIPNKTLDLDAENPKVVITPAISNDNIYNQDTGGYVWTSKLFSVWIAYRNKRNSSIHVLLIKNEKSLAAEIDTDSTDFIFAAGRTGLILSNDMSGPVTDKLTYFSTTGGYQSYVVFNSNNSPFKCENKYDFDIDVWEDYTEPGLLYQDTIENGGPDQKIHLKGTPVIVASNSIPNDQGKQYELVVIYKSPNNSIVDWSIPQFTNKYGRQIKIKNESIYGRNFENNIFEPGISNNDNLHIFYISYESEQLLVPSYIHNKYGTWESENENKIVYKHRIRNFSDPIEYLDFTGIKEFDFDLNEFGEVDFAAFYNSSNITNRGLFFVNQQFQSKYAIWSSPLGSVTSGPGPRSGFTHFYYKGYMYIQGGYGLDNSIDSSMWRLHIKTGNWERIITDNAPPRVFHLSDIVENVAYKGTLDSQTQFDFDNIIPTFNSLGESGIDFDQSQFVVWAKISKFGARIGQVALESAYLTQSYQSFFEYSDSIEPLDSVTGLPLRDVDDVEDLTNKVKTTEGYRDSIIGFELYNLTSGSHGVITDISAPINTSGQITNFDAYVAIQVNKLSGSSRSDNEQFKSGDQIVISYPGKPAFDQIIMYGGGSFDSSQSNGYPDDLDGGVTNPPDSVSLSGNVNVGDNQVYRDARTIFIGNIDSRRENKVKFTFIPTAPSGTNSAPVPCISGSLAVTNYTVDSIGGISNYPNFVLLNRSNAYRFKLSYEQDSSQTGRPFSFLGRWFQLDPLKSNNGEPIEGITAWKGAKLFHYGGIKPAPYGHADNPYLESTSIIYFGGFTRSDFDSYYSNSLLIINVNDVSLGWSLIEPFGDNVPSSRSGNGIMVTNRLIEDIEDTFLPKENDGSTYIDYNKFNDLDSEVWITCGNDKDLNPQNYIRSNAKNDIWQGKFIYQKRRVNLGTISSVVSFQPGSQPYEAVINLKVNSGLNSFIVPNGLRTSNNNLNSVGDTYNVNTSKYKNDRYTELSINDTNDPDYIIYNGSDPASPDWISEVTVNGDTRSNIDGTYYPESNNILGERRWTVLSKLTITIPAGPGTGNHVIYIGVYNNGINSYVEYFIPNESSFAFGLAFLEFSGGKYNDDINVSDGKSWFDVGTGTLHLQIRNTLQESIRTEFMPYVSKIENVKFVELTNVKWNNFTSHVGIKPFKNTWGGFIGHQFDKDTGVYFGGRTHSSTIINNVHTWNPPTTFIQNEKTDLYFISEIDGTNNNKWIQLKHKDIVKNAATTRLGETLDHFVENGEYYSAWGVAKIILDRSPDSSQQNSQKYITYLGFNIIPYIRNNILSNIDLHEGMGLISFEEINYPFGLSDGTDINTPLLEGEINYKEGKIRIECIYEAPDIYHSPGTGIVSNSNQFTVNVNPLWTTNELVGKILRIPERHSTAGDYTVSSNTQNTITVSGSPFIIVETVDAVILNSTDTIDLSNDILFQIVDINYHTYEGIIESKIEEDTFNGSIVRYIGDKVGGDYSTRIPSWVYTNESSIDASNISYIRDDRAQTFEFNTSIYSEDKYISIQGDIISTTEFEVTNTTFIVDELVSKVLYISSKNGYYEIISNTDDTITISGNLGTNETDLSASIMNDYIRLSDIIGNSGIKPNTKINVPRWFSNEMRELNNIYETLITPETSDLSDILGIVQDNINLDIIGDPVRTFGRITFRKLREDLSSDPEIEYYQFFIKEGFGTTPILTGGDQLILKIDNNLQEYDAISDIDNLNLIYVDNVTELTTDYWDIQFDLAVGSSSLGILDGFEIEIDTLAYNDSMGPDTMKIPTEVFDPRTFIQWQDTYIKVLFSFNDGLTWKKYDINSDLWIAVDPQDVIEQGMEFTDLFNIISWPWSGWNNYLRAQERNLPSPYLGFEEGKTGSISMFVGLETQEPSHTPSINGLIMNFYSGTFWEAKNFHQEGTLGNDNSFLQVKLLSPTTTVIKNNHATNSNRRNLKTTIMLNQNF